MGIRLSRISPAGTSHAVQLAFPGALVRCGSDVPNSVFIFNSLDEWTPCSVRCTARPEEREPGGEVIDRGIYARILRQAATRPLVHDLPFLPPYSAAVGRSWGVALPGNGCAAGSRRSDQSAYPN